MTNTPKAGDVFRVVFPFVKEDFEAYEEDGPVIRKSWRPGVLIEMTDWGDSDIWVHSEGEMVLTVVDIFKPGRFPMRVFYTRSFVDPDGKPFGKGGLKICTLEKFGRMAAGYAVGYVPDETFAEAAERRAEVGEAA